MDCMAWSIALGGGGVVPCAMRITTWLAASSARTAVSVVARSWPAIVDIATFATSAVALASEEYPLAVGGCPLPAPPGTVCGNRGGRSFEHLDSAMRSLPRLRIRRKALPPCFSRIPSSTSSRELKGSCRPGPSSR